MAAASLLVWSVGLAAPLAMAGVALGAAIARHRWARPLCVATLLAGGWNVGVWLLLRRVVQGGAFEKIFLQCSMSAVAIFFFVAIAMVATWRQHRRGG